MGCGAWVLGYDAFFLEGTNGLRTNFHRHLLAIYDKRLGLKVWLPHLFSVALREANIAAELLALASDFTLLHC